MLDELNRPEAFLESIHGAPRRLALLDTVLGAEREQAFTKALSALVAHGNFQMPGLNAVVRARDPDLHGHVCTFISAAACELETGWHTLRLGNIPAAYRQSRVALEFVGMAVLSAMPRRCLEQLPRGRGRPLPGLLEKNPGCSVLDLWDRSAMILRGGLATGEPLFKAMSAPTALIDVCESHLGVLETATELKAILVAVQHPAAHASADTRFYQILGVERPVFGCQYESARNPYYRDTADLLIHLARSFAFILSKVRSYLLEAAEATLRVVGPGA